MNDFEKRRFNIDNALMNGSLTPEEYFEVRKMIDIERKKLCIIDDEGRIIIDEDNRVNFKCKNCNGKTESKGYRSSHPQYQRRICYICHKETMINPKTGEVIY